MSAPPTSGQKLPAAPLLPFKLLDNALQLPSSTVQSAPESDYELMKNNMPMLLKTRREENATISWLLSGSSKLIAILDGRAFHFRAFVEYINSKRATSTEALQEDISALPTQPAVPMSQVRNVPECQGLWISFIDAIRIAGDYNLQLPVFQLANFSRTAKLAYLFCSDCDGHMTKMLTRPFCRCERILMCGRQHAFCHQCCCILQTASEMQKHWTACHTLLYQSMAIPALLLEFVLTSHLLHVKNTGR
jgi:hypothetical protein